jgi:hypothetical protein
MRQAPKRSRTAAAATLALRSARVACFLATWHAAVPFTIPL